MIYYTHAYRWLAQFFLSPPDMATLDGYREAPGQSVLTTCDATPALAPVSAMIRERVAPGCDLKAEQDRFRRAFSAAFDVGGPRSTPPYASVYLSDTGRLFQRPAREMNRILQGLEMSLPPEVNEAPDHLGVQLYVAAELCDREQAGAPIETPVVRFLELHLLSWLPAFVQRCGHLRDPETISVPASAALQLVTEDIAQRRKALPDEEKIAAMAQSVMGTARVDI